MKFQWNTMTQFARRILRKLGAVPTSDYEDLEALCKDLYSSLRERAMLDAGLLKRIADDPTVTAFTDPSFTYRTVRVDLPRMSPTSAAPIFEVVHYWNSAGIRRALVFEYGGRYWRMKWAEGATEYQDTEFEPVFTEVAPVQETVTVYKEVPK